MVNARFGRDPPNMVGGLHWRVYSDKPDASGVVRMLREERAAAPTFVLPPGGYLVRVSCGPVIVRARWSAFEVGEL